MVNTGISAAVYSCRPGSQPVPQPFGSLQYDQALQAGDSWHNAQHSDSVHCVFLQELPRIDSHASCTTVVPVIFPCTALHSSLAQPASGAQPCLLHLLSPLAGPGHDGFEASGAGEHAHGGARYPSAQQQTVTCPHESILFLQQYCWQHTCGLARKARRKRQANFRNAKEAFCTSTAAWACTMSAEVRETDAHNLLLPAEAQGSASSMTTNKLLSIVSCQCMYRWLLQRRSHRLVGSVTLCTVFKSSESILSDYLKKTCCKQKHSTLDDAPDKRHYLPSSTGHLQDGLSMAPWSGVVSLSSMCCKGAVTGGTT